jgi:hypothetical protein
MTHNRISAIACALALLCAAAFCATPIAIDVVNPTGTALTDAIVTFGQVFMPGDIPAGKLLSATSGGAGIPVQTDPKATHADGSLRHAVITMRVPSIAANGSQHMLMTPAAPIPTTAPVSLAGLLATSYDVTVSLTIGGTAYAASAKAMLTAAQSGAGPATWLSGPLASEWLVSGAPTTSGGLAHPHLSVRFHVRAYAGLGSVRTDVVVENDWAFEPDPQGFTYDVTIASGGTTAYSKAGLKHTHHSRWHTIVWWGQERKADVKHDIDYLLATRAVPNYDRSVAVSSSALSAMAATYGPMSCGDLTSYMPATGAHDDIGPLPRFAALYLLSMDLNAKANMLANGGCGGSYQIHYRDKVKDMPVTLDDYPYMTIVGNPGDTYNPKTGKSEGFPAVTNGLDTLTPDDAHQPSIAYLPYLISGDYFFLEELLFWTNWNLFYTNPGYRDNVKGLFKSLQERGQAWDMRTLGQAAYITPDSHPQKAGLIDKLNNNIVYYSTKYADTIATNRLGYIDDGYSLAYAPYGIAPWQDDFFTYSIGSLVDLGFTNAKDLLLFKSRFVVGRMTDPGFCWLHATAYSLQVGASAANKYQTFAELYQANFPNPAACTGLVMDGYPSDATGYGGNMQPGLAAAVDARAPHAAEAWAKYETRNPKQDYSSSPQFAVVPRIDGSAARNPDVGRANQPGGVSGRTNCSVLLFGFGNQFCAGNCLYDLRGRRIAFPGKSPESGVFVMIAGDSAK